MNTYKIIFTRENGTQGNANPILRAFIEWCDALAATKEKEDTQQ